MRLAAISDIHGNLPALEAVAADLRRQAPDALVCLGDISLRGPRPAECVDLLRSLAPLAVVRGNHDDCLTDEDFVPHSFKEERDLHQIRWHNRRVPKATFDWLTSLPVQEHLTLEGVRVDLFHAAPGSLTEVNYPWAPEENLSKLCLDESAGLVLYGHIHRGFVRHAGGRMVANPGSVGIPFDGDTRAAYAIIDIEAGNIAVQLRRITYDVELAVQLAREMPMPEAMIDSLRTAAFTFHMPYHT